MKILKGFMKKEKILFFIVIVLLPLLLKAKAIGDSVEKKIIISGHSGSGPGQVGSKIKAKDTPYEAAPSAIAIDSNGNIYSGYSE